MMQPTDFRSRARTVRDAARKQLLKLREERLNHKSIRLASAGQGSAPPPVAVDEVEELVPEGLAPENLVAEGFASEVLAPEGVVPEVEVPEVTLPVTVAPDPEEALAPPPEVKPKAAKRKAPAKPARKPQRATLPEAPEDHSIRRAALAEMFDEAPPAVPAESVHASDPAEEFPLDDILAAGPPAPAADLVEAEAAVEPVASEASIPPSPAKSVDDLHLLPGAGPGLIWMLRQCGITCLADLATCDGNDLSRKLGLVGQILDVSVWRSFAMGQVAPMSQAS
ncbi:hypothetical protein NX862_01480 [Rhodobacter sp. KR11]|uniref:hypothetical protein n=1 Tax=Rhodobacter sp. KR11 TaxID=2974588 RepID=UPI0022234795|nr:hypothetical protein [Rhodobacter sp. KR11]MCW1917416.1 hypothetical protein [Rhodobacter sp. KR11]